jgi:AraC-like DNA-binding protein
MRLERGTFRSLCRARDLLCALDDDEAPSVAEVARAVAISRFHFIRQFEALFGETPHQLRLRARLELAKRLLAADRQSVTEVCMAVGFSSLGSFSALFRRRVGVTPSRYRARARALVQVPGALPRELEPGCLSLMARLPADAFRNFREA